MTLLIFILFLVFVAIGTPVGFALGIVSLILIYFFYDPAFLIVMARKLFTGVDSFILMAAPLFMVAGAIMNQSGITDSLVDFSKKIVGHLRGGLAQVNIVASIFFAGLTGAAMADVAALGSILIPAMEKDGYSRSFSAAVTAASSVIGPIIPPSVVMLIYAHVMGESVASLFIAGVFPGLVLGLAMMVCTNIIARKRHYKAATERPTPKILVKSFIKSIPALVAPLIILGSIVLGVCTPTEAAALAIVYSILLGYIFRKKVRARILLNILFEATLVCSVVYLIIGTASQLGYIIADLKMPQNIAESLLGITHNKYTLFFLINLFLLLMGMILEIIPNIILLSPILAPLAIKYGIHPIHFATVMLVNLNIGMNTPPMGGLLFITASVANEKFELVLKEIWPYIGSQIIALFIVTYFPAISLWLPGIMGLL